jgi:CheY-like chemotaxis protein
MAQPAKILVIDDDPDYVELTKTILESKGYQVDFAYNKSEGRAKITSYQPDLIILDIIMERLNSGFKLCSEIKNDPNLKHIPVLTVSSVNEVTGFTFSPDTDGEYFQADDFAEKPIKAADLLERVQRLLKFRK